MRPVSHSESRQTESLSTSPQRRNALNSNGSVSVQNPNEQQSVQCPFLAGLEPQYAFFFEQSNIDSFGLRKCLVVDIKYFFVRRGNVTGNVQKR